MRAAATILLGLAAELATATAAPRRRRNGAWNGSSRPTAASRSRSTPPAPLLRRPVPGPPRLQGATLSLDVDSAGSARAARSRASNGRATHRRAGRAPDRRRLEEKHNELRLACAGGYAIAFRAYDLGVAYGFETTLPRAEVKIAGEEATFRFAADAGVYYPREESFFSHNERQFKRVRSTAAPGRARQHPAVVETHAGPKVAIAEVGSGGLPRALAARHGRPGADGDVPPYPLEEKLTGDRDFGHARGRLHRRHPRHADVSLARAGRRRARRRPGRQSARLSAGAPVADRGHVVDPARQGGLGLVERAQPARRDFKPGVNNGTYQAYIDFAAQYGLEYVILDEGWYKTGEILSVVPALDMPKLLAYAATSTSASSCGRSGRRSRISSGRRWPSSKGGASPA